MAINFNTNNKSYKMSYGGKNIISMNSNGNTMNFATVKIISGGMQFIPNNMDDVNQNSEGFTVALRACYKLVNGKRVATLIGLSNECFNQKINKKEEEV